MLGDVGNFIGRHGELDPNSKTSGEVQTRQMTICLFREPLRIQGQPPQLDSRREKWCDDVAFHVPVPGRAACGGVLSGVQKSRQNTRESQS